MGGFRLVGGLLDECLNFAEVFSKLLIDIALALVLLAAGGIEVNHHGRAGHQQGKESKQSQKAEGDFPVGPAGNSIYFFWVQITHPSLARNRPAFPWGKCKLP